MRELDPFLEWSTSRRSNGSSSVGTYVSSAGSVSTSASAPSSPFAPASARTSTSPPPHISTPAPPLARAHVPPPACTVSPRRRRRLSSASLVPLGFIWMDKPADFRRPRAWILFRIPRFWIVKLGNSTNKNQHQHREFDSRNAHKLGTYLALGLLDPLWHRRTHWESEIRLAICTGWP